MSTKSNREEAGTSGDVLAQPRSYKYRAFITYSHADLPLAEALQSGLHSFAKPWNQMRAIRVFRDKTNLTANPDLWSSIEAAIVDSEFLLIMASPEAAKSQWVPREIETFLRSNSPERVILLLSGGELAWDDANNDFDWKTTTAFPKLAEKVFSKLPLYIDLRSLRKEEHLSLRNPDFRSSIANLSSALRGIPLDVLIGRDVLEHRKTMRLARSAVAGLSGLTLILAFVSILAVRARARAEEQTRIAIEQRNIAISRQLSVQSQTYLDESLDLASLLAVEASRAKDTVEARAALLNAVQNAPQLVAYLHAHNAAVTSVSFSPDGTLASGGRDGDPTLRLWSAENFQPLIAPIHAEKFRVEHVAFTPDGRILASGGDGGVVRLWNGKTGERLDRELRLKVPSIESLVFSPTGILAVGDGWGGLSVWNVETGKQVSPRIQAHPEDWGDPHGTGGSNTVAAVAFTSDRKVLATGAMDGTIRFWNPETLKPIRTPIRASKPGEGVRELAFSHDGQVLASTSQASGTVLQLWNPATGQKLAGPEKIGRWHGPLVYAPGDVLISAGDDGYLRAWDGKKLTPLSRPLPAHQADVWSLALSRNNLIAASGGDGSIVLWNLWAISPIAHRITRLSAQILGLAFGPDGTLAAADGVSAKLLSPGAPLPSTPSLQTNEPITSLAFSDGGLLAAGGQKGSLRLWNAKNQTVLETAEHVHKTLAVDGAPMQDQVSRVTFSPDGAVLASAGFLDGSFLLWDGKTLASLTEKPIQGEMGYLYSLAFSPNGEMIAASSEQGMIRIWNVHTRQPLTPPIRAHGTGRPQVVFGSEIAGKPDTVFSEGAGPTFLAYSPDGTLASGGFDKQIRLWNGKTGASIGAPIAFPTPLNDIVFSPDGRLLAGSGWDGVVRLWDAKTLQYVGGLIGAANRVSRISFSRDGNTLVAGYLDGQIVSWDLRLGTWQSAAQTLANRSLTPEEEARFLGARK